MDKSEVKRIVEENLVQYMDAFGIPHWSVGVNYTACSNPNWSAECDRAGGDYEKATITIDPAYADSEEDVLKSLRHELFHVVLAPFDLHRDSMCQRFDKDSELDRIESRVWSHCVEKAVLHLERMYVGMCELNISRNEPKKFIPELGPIGLDAERKNGKPHDEVLPIA